MARGKGRKAKVDWHCDSCGENKTAMYGNPDSGICLECHEAEAAIAAEEDAIEAGQARWSETGSTRGAR